MTNTGVWTDGGTHVWMYADGHSGDVCSKEGKTQKRIHTYPNWSTDK